MSVARQQTLDGESVVVKSGRRPNLTPEQAVRYILEKYPETREDDLALWFRICEEFYGLEEHLGTEHLQRLYDWIESADPPLPDTMSRRRRETQMLSTDYGTMLPSESTIEHRRALSKAGPIWRRGRSTR
jgi:hypothetical protein